MVKRKFLSKKITRRKLVKITKNYGGRPAFRPTDVQRRLVRSLSATGVPQDEICILVKNPTTGRPISKKTLVAHFRAELDEGSATANAAVVENLFKMATAKPLTDRNNQPYYHGSTLAAAIFWTKARLGWEDRQRILHSGADGQGSAVVQLFLPDNGRGDTPPGTVIDGKAVPDPELPEPDKTKQLEHKKGKK